MKNSWSESFSRTPAVLISVLPLLELLGILTPPASPVPDEGDAAAIAESEEVVKLWVIRVPPNPPLDPLDPPPDPLLERFSITLSGRTNLPRFLPAVKYLTPFTDPSFLPEKYR